MDTIHHPDRYSGDAFDSAVLQAIRNGGPAWAAPAVPALGETLKSPNDDIRTHAIYALSGLGPLAKSAEPELRHQ